MIYLTELRKMSGQCRLSDLYTSESRMDGGCPAERARGGRTTLGRELASNLVANIG
jgi:hypothetical protein